MYHKQLVNHVSARLTAGMSPEDIKTELTFDGWNEEDIKDAFYYHDLPEKAKHFSIRKFFHSEVPAVFTIIVFFSTIILITGVYFFGERTLNYNINITTASSRSPVTFSYGEQPALSNPDFFAKIKGEFITNKADFIEADLSAMVIRVYKKGEATLEVPINSKGREGSWWETPAGLYKISSKEKAHFSGMGHVWMPWSMNFQGNFFIHGRTYYPDGTLTAKEFTGGCIRLSTEDAEKVFSSVSVGTPILVFERSFESDNFVYTDNIPSLSAPVYLAADMKNNHVFANKDSALILPIASITKLMTALIATEYINLDSIATVPKDALVYTSKSRLTAGAQLSIYQLLFPLLMESSNEAAETIARYSGRSTFIKHMNEKAASIGMLQTTFTDPSGASEGNVSSAEDLFILAKYIYNNRSFIFNITSGKVKNTIYGTSGFTDLGNYNDFVNHEFFFGGKNGKTTAAHETNLSVFELPAGETKRPIVMIVLKSQNEKKDSEALLEYVVNHFR